MHPCDAVGAWAAGHVRKCEAYAYESLELPDPLKAIPRVASRSDWTYLGAPLWTESNTTTKSAAARATQVAARIQKFGQQAPLQALELLRHTAGACRVVHLCQAAPPEELASDLLQPTTASLRQALEGILGCPVETPQWQQATLPCRNGGLGLGDPANICHAARLAALVNTTEKAVELGLPLDHARSEIEQALKAFNERWGLHHGVPTPEKNLQKQLMTSVHEVRRALIMANASADEVERLDSVCTPHAADWLRGPGQWFSLTDEEARYGIRWVLGIPLVDEPYLCPWCERPADRLGLHAAACEASGAVARGHTAVKCVLADLYRAAGAHVDTEQGPEDRNRRPADLLVSGPFPKPWAIDNTIWSRHTDGPDPLDAVVQRKVAAGKRMCQRQGWTYRVWAADVYGCMHPDARKIILKLAGMVERKCPTHGEGQQRQQVWRSVSAAVISRAAGQLARHAAVISPPRALSEGADTLGIPHDACVDQPGVCDYGQSEDEAESDNVLDEDVPAEEAQGEEAAPMEAEAAEEPPITLAVRLPTGSVLPVRVSRTYNTGVLLERLRAECGLPDSAQRRLGLALGFAPLDLARSLRENDIQEGDTLELKVAS